MFIFRRTHQAPCALLLVIACLFGDGRLAEAEEGGSTRHQLPKVFLEVAQLFQDGKDVIDLEEMKAMLVACSDLHDMTKPFSQQARTFYEKLDEVLEYLDGHRLEASDIDALRQWQAMSLKVKDESPEGSENALANRLWMALRGVWGAAQEGEAPYEPRHALFFSLITFESSGYSELRCVATRTNQAKRAGDATRTEQTKGVIEQFLGAPARKPLLAAACDDDAILARADTLPDYNRLVETAQQCLDKKEDHRVFREKCEMLFPLYKTSLAAYPSHAYPDRFRLAVGLRQLWNMIHAYGDAEGKQKCEKFVSALKQEYSGKGDALMSGWLTEATAMPSGDPPEFFLLRTTATLGEDDGAGPKGQQLP
jgi:hypothetical protein